MLQPFPSPLSLFFITANKSFLVMEEAEKLESYRSQIFEVVLNPVVFLF